MIGIDFISCLQVQVLPVFVCDAIFLLEPDDLGTLVALVFVPLQSFLA